MLVFIIAGVGDNTTYIEERTHNWSSEYNLEPVVLRFGWRGDYNEKYTALRHVIEERAGENKFAVIGISAGGSTAIRLYSELAHATCAITICGRTTRGGFHLTSLKSYPAYWDSVDKLRTVKPKSNILVVKPLFDEIVSTVHMDYAGAKILRVPYLFHIPSIFLTLSRQSDQIARFIRG